MLLETDAFARWRRSRQSAEVTPPVSRLFGGARRSPLWDDGAPIQAELFSVERLEEQCRANDKPGVLKRITCALPAAAEVLARVRIEVIKNVD